MFRQFFRRLFTAPPRPKRPTGFLVESPAELLHECKHLFAALAQPCVRITARDTETPLSEDPLSATASKFGGIPFWPAGEPVPDDLTSATVVLLAQLNLADVPTLAGWPSDGLLQLFVDGDFELFDTDAIAIYRPAEQLFQPTTPLEELGFQFPDDYFFTSVHRLSFAADTDSGCRSDESFQDAMSKKLEAHWPGRAWTDDEMDLLEDQFNGDGHRLGGYAMFTQHDPRGHPSRPTYQLLQIDSTDGIMIGDGGLIHIFLDPVNIRPGRVADAWYYWDCC